MVLDRARRDHPFAAILIRPVHPTMTFRAAEPADHAEFARFFVELGHDDPIPDRERWVREWMPHTFFLEEGGTRLGYAFVEPYGERGYVRHVVVGPGHRGRGVGRALMQAVARHLKALGAREWELNVRRENAPAIHLYEAVGMHEDFATFVVRLDWSALASLPDSFFPTRHEQAAPEHDAEIERIFRMPSGLVARSRSFAGQHLVRLLDADGRLAGFARFDPAFPGAYPFRVTDPEFTRPLLEALRPHARAEHDWLQLVVEDDAPTAALLLANGARLVFEILHMRGPIPC